jgi:ribosomal protein S18 acetylase RimI-like enzyme
MRLGWLKQRTPAEDGPCDFLYYENGNLVGYLLVDRYGRTARELTGMVHPEHRHKGIFTELLTAARAEWQARGVERFLLICEEASRSGQAFVAQQGAQHESSECRMVLGAFHESRFFDDRLVFRRATPGDIQSVVMILAEDAHEEFEAVTPYAIDFFREPNCHVYITLLGEGGVSCREPIGCLRVYELEDELGIYGFVIRPEYRGRGYGRQMLEETIRALREVSTKPVTLEVDTRNTPALNLYRSCGFEEETTYGYYALK